MKEIKQTAIIGMGALGLLYGNRIAESLGNDSVCFVADSDRVKRYADTTFTINGVEKHFAVKASDDATPVDLVIVATKYNHLPQAIEVMANCVGDDTTIISVINGISSEEIISERFGTDKVLYTVAQGMDAVKEGGDFNYVNFGELRTGQTCDMQKDRFAALINFFDKAKIPYTIDEDIIHRMWGKFMLNVGINQSCMVYETTYGGVVNDEEKFKVMDEAMQEVIKVAKAEGVNLTQADADGYVALMKSLNPDATPSMRQDGMQKRPSEVEMFAGKIIALGKQHNIPVPVNKMLYKKVAQMEAKY